MSILDSSTTKTNMIGNSTWVRDVFPTCCIVVPIRNKMHYRKQSISSQKGEQKKRGKVPQGKKSERKHGQQPTCAVTDIKTLEN